MVFLFAFNLSPHLQKHNLCTFFKETWPLGFWEYWLLSSDWPRQDGSCVQHLCTLTHTLTHTHSHTHTELTLARAAGNGSCRPRGEKQIWQKSLKECLSGHVLAKVPTLLAPDTGCVCDLLKRSFIVTLRPCFKILKAWIISLRQHGIIGVYVSKRLGIRLIKQFMSESWQFSQKES